ncbi:Uma2 family endonuclease [Chondromyces crocatus]|uniref:Putative restriction endonuclease domain-containing protein n=1 Tax=Chondromyces crocatus TaxID=52 RepID=A0A0K1ELK3_CHOCO|nr:Uma2 family endonuclease [Chondromyces crocatus]AKT41765.1 uncharacterized protein CMC5_059760 [Chondromyces crocatus]
MGHPAERRPRFATPADLEAAPAQNLTEFIAGTRHPFPRHTPAQAHTASRLGRRLGPFDDDPGGPGGWVLLDTPELHLGQSVLVPDLAGWRIARMPRLPRKAHFTLAPDWIAEVLSPSTTAHDRAAKMPVYAAAGVPWVWLIDPLLRFLEVHHLGPDDRWTVAQVYRGEGRVRAFPFDAIELGLASLWPSFEDEPPDTTR